MPNGVIWKVVSLRLIWCLQGKKMILWRERNGHCFEGKVLNFW